MIAKILSLLFCLSSLSCVHRQVTARTVSSDNWIVFHPQREEILPLPEAQCPAETQLKSATVILDPQSCVKNYIHEKKSHGVLRSRLCFPPPTKHEDSLRIPPRDKIYASVIKTIFIPTTQGPETLMIKLNHAYYTLAWNGPQDASAKTVKEAFLSAPLPRKVKLERCECNTQQFSLEECSQKLSPLLQTEFVYRVGLPQ